MRLNFGTRGMSLQQKLHSADMVEVQGVSSAGLPLPSRSAQVLALLGPQLNRGSQGGVESCLVHPHDTLLTDQLGPPWRSERNTGREKLNHCRRYSPEHGIAEELSCACQLSSSTFPSLVRNRQVQQFHGPVESLLAALRILFIPTGGACHVAPDIGQLLHERESVPSSCG